ncbi:MAG: cupredoxin domain-containing protein [Candidatus Uhrbacteria bacterium]|nr:cupredoxin domain-containing protein [Candidatus Uhrbacteria bacterium]
MKQAIFVSSLFFLLGAGCLGIDSDNNESIDESEQLTTQVTVEEISEPVKIQGELVTSDGMGVPTSVMIVNEAGVVEDTGDMSSAIQMESGNFFFMPNTISASTGEQVTINFTENSGIHTFVIDEIGFKEIVVEGDDITFTAPSTPGSYAYYCDIGSHRALGMKGLLIVK